MPSPQVVAREPGRRIKKSNKPERREEQPVDTDDMDMDSPTPPQQSKKAGPGTGGGRERSRRVTERIPRVAGAKAHEKSYAADMLDKGVGKKLAKQAKQRTAGRKSASELDELHPPATPQPRRHGAKTQSRAAKAKTRAKAKPPAKKRAAAAAAEAAPTQKQVLRDKPPRKRPLRDEGVD